VQLLAYVGGTRSFRRTRHLWSYAGLTIVTRSSSDHRIEEGRLVGQPRTRRGLTRSYHPQLTRLLRDTALAASLGSGPMKAYFDAHVEGGLTIHVARLVLARRIASAIRAILRDNVPFDSRLFLNLPGTGSKHQKDVPPINEARA
jgi:transposase